MSSKRVAVVLSGCGVFDGAEIHESVLTLLALDRQGATYQCFAPNVPQRRVFDHLAGEAVEETRNVLTEAARIARGNIQDVANANIDDFDAAILPGGFGAALNLSSYAVAGADMAVEETTKQFLINMHKANKPLAALCIAPPILARILREIGEEGAHLTVGLAEGPDGANLAALGATPANATVTETIIDRKHNIVSSPAYMCETGLSDLSTGIDNTVSALLDLASS